MGFVSKHLDRDLLLPKHRDILLENALNDLKSDSNVLAIYQAGSLAKGNFDNYSDIDLHIVVTPERKPDFIKDKHNRARKWGDVLFYEDLSAMSPVIVTHYESFIKVDSWYHSPEDVVPSIWLRGYKVLYDPKNIISEIIKDSSNVVYKPSSDEVEFWRGKILSFIHETYRAVMRDEKYYALSNLDRVRWLVVSGWYMEMKQHLDSPYGVWSKIEGKRSKLDQGQLSLLESWDCCRNTNEIMKTLVSMVPEILRLNKLLSKLVNINENEDHLKKVLEMVY
ncbi:nucleotidyltransferase domain-containing protein [Cytobacillus gottheilii]|uniref:Aminoglycoside 6-adenylyltransferase n=1 Tax=Cytobacillus gottheilii TaxID=859144 RepID=A0ABX8FD94_9BACI|nr:nucleotidyltransferase domain-containing protein [Cytobacillus gottheilii]QVY62115.1 aminoglycoside 6-adenylyltransferase [Cytobacillus gottheilii]